MAIWCSPAWRTIPKPWRPCAPWDSAMPPMSRAPSAAGIMAASAPCAQPRARELLTKLMPAILKALAGDRRSRCRLRPVRPLSFQPAVGRAAFLAVPGAAGISGPAGQDRGLGAAAGQLSGAQSGHPGCAAGCRFPQPPARPRASWMRVSPRQLRAAAMKRCWTARGALRGKRFSASACRSWKARPRPKRRARPWPAIAESVIAGLLPGVEDELAASAGPRAGRRLSP